jgi:hypothetical protein
MEGTKSYLLGVHHFLVHPLCVLIAWRQHFHSWPEPWQVVCIFIHDIGIIGLNYLSGNKEGHWRRGAHLAEILFGPKGYYFCAGHTSEFFVEFTNLRSDLFWADKKSWLVVPDWFAHFSHWIEKLPTTPQEWKAIVSENMGKENPEDSHKLYLRYIQKGHNQGSGEEEG